MMSGAAERAELVGAGGGLGGGGGGWFGGLRDGIGLCAWGGFEVDGAPGVGAELGQDVLGGAPEVVQGVLEVSEVDVEGQGVLFLGVVAVQGFGGDEDLDYVAVGEDAADLLDRGVRDQAVLEGVAVAVELADGAGQA